MTDKVFADGWPQPPSWYKKMANYEPPNIPAGQVNVFGSAVPYSIRKEPNNLNIELLLKQCDINIPVKAINLAFALIFEELVKETMKLISYTCLSGTLYDNKANETTKRIIQLYQSLFNILKQMRRYEYYNSVKKHLLDENKMKRSFISRIYNKIFGIEFDIDKYLKNKKTQFQIK